VTRSRTRDGGIIVGTSVFYSEPLDDVTTSTPQTVSDEVERLNQELQVSLALSFFFFSCCCYSQLLAFLVDHIDVFAYMRLRQSSVVCNGCFVSKCYV